MIDLNERAKTMRIARESIIRKTDLSDQDKIYVLTMLLKKLIKYRAHKI